MGFFSSVLKVAAPVIGFAFGGPAGAAAGSALASVATGGNLKQTVLSAALAYGGAQFAAAGGLVGGEGFEQLAGSAGNFSFGDAASNAFQGLAGNAADKWVADPVTGLLVNSADAAGGVNGAASGGMNFGKVASLAGQGLSAYSSFENAGALRDASKAADPFAAFRGDYAAQLSQLMSNPNSITDRPGYAAGLTAVERKGAAQGWNGSGNMMNALSEYGGKFFNDEVARLATLAGANISPAVNLTGQIAANTQQANAFAQLGMMLPRGTPAPAGA